MDLDTQIEQTRIALQILEGRKQGAEPEWEWKAEFSNWIPCSNQGDADPVLCVAHCCTIRLKPWTLGTSVNGFTLQAGQQWHREDWTQDMLPEGWRPLLYCEVARDGDEYLTDTKWKARGDGYDPVTAKWLFHRTTRPLPVPHDPYAELRAARAAGKVIQLQEDDGIWRDLEEPGWMFPISRYRIKPEEPKQPSIKLGDWIQEPTGIGFLVTKTQGTSIFYDDDWAEIADLSSAIMISRDQGATWEPINKTHV